MAMPRVPVFSTAKALPPSIALPPAGRAIGSFCSDGSYAIEKDGARVELDLGEMLTILDHMRVVRHGVMQGVEAT